MISRTALALPRAPQWALASSLLRRVPAQLTQRRLSSSQQPSNHKQFYKTFGRPIFKVVLLAVFTYQLAYYAWTRLEQDEIMADRQAEISELEAKVESLQPAKASK